MKITPKKLNQFLFFKLPSAFWCGVRVLSINESVCCVTVRHKWINQNPFRSMYFAVQAMAAELCTGALVMTAIQESGRKISMLVAQNNAEFTKKATGKITFVCEDGVKIREAIQQAIKTGEGQKFWMQSIGKDEKENQVAVFNFEWTIKLK
ncbi:MAG TPA: DUF4442 domain-containing protein [Flavobacterium sp.]|nr:DUF4442 domain-containing protein [Flavobacterium sp.]